MREVLIWDNFFNDKENFECSPYFMLNHDLKNQKLINAKNNIKEFMDSYLNNKAICGTNKDSFHGVNSTFSFWHYHCEPYNQILTEFYHNKKCFDKKTYTINSKKVCTICNSLDYKLGRESAHVIYYVKFNNSDIIGIVAYATKHIPFPTLNEKTIQSVMRAKQANFNLYKL